MADPSTLQHQDPAAAVRAFVAGAYTSPPPALLNSIRGRTLSFLQLVRILGEYLTDEQDHIRARGLSLLSGVLQYLALPASPADAAGVPTQSTKVNVNVIGEKEKRELSDILNRQATRTLAAFFADKLDDAATLGAYPATATSEQGENASKDRATIGKEMTMEILRALNVLARLDTFGAEDARAVAQG